MPVFAKTKEKSPIWLRAIPTNRAVLIGKVLEITLLTPPVKVLIAMIAKANANIVKG